MTLFTSDNRKNLQNNLFSQLCFCIFCALFGAVYECFSHEVYSGFMIYAFAVPLVLAVLPLAWILWRDRGSLPVLQARRLWNYGVITLTVGSLFMGVLEIYGTTNRLAAAYPAAGALLLGAAIAVQACAKQGGKNGKDADGGEADRRASRPAGSCCAMRQDIIKEEPDRGALLPAGFDGLEEDFAAADTNP